MWIGLATLVCAQLARGAAVRAEAIATAEAAATPDEVAVLDPVRLDGFEGLEGWTVTASEGSQAWITQEPGRAGMAMRLAFDLNHAGGWVLVRKTFPFPLPENFAFTFDLRGEGPRNNFEFKLVDPRGRSVWWRRYPDFTFPPDWQRMTVRKSRLELAWGPPGAKELKQLGAIELAVSAGEGGTGSLWIEDLVFEERERAEHNGPAHGVQASTSVAGHEAALMMDGDPGTAWRSDPSPEQQWVLIDLGRNHELGGLAIDWDAQDFAAAYEVQLSSDGTQWSPVHATTTGHAGRTYIYLPDAEARFIRLALERSSAGRGYAIDAITVKPFDFSASPSRFFEAIARDAPPGVYPRYLLGRQTYWTVVGVSGDERKALLNDDGLLEVDRGAFSIEPFLRANGQLVTWQQAQTGQQLEDGYLPIPSVTWEHERLRLRVTAFADGAPGASILYATYRVENRDAASAAVDLLLAVRPFQVLPPWQSLNLAGGVTPIKEMRFDGRAVWVNRAKAVVPLAPPEGFGAIGFAAGSLVDFLLAGELPPYREVSDPSGFASGALRYRLDLEPGGHAEVALAIPFHDAQAAIAGDLAAAGDPGLVARRLGDVRESWRTTLDRVELGLPPAARKITDTVKTSIADILINRRDAAIQPGPRTYARSWIRDGAMTSEALLEMGFPQEVRDFLRWFAAYQLPDGRVPCCVDRRGADPVTENDSPGAFIYAIMQYYRFTHDIGFLHEMWPRVVRAVDYMSALRRRRMTEEFQLEDKRAYFGLLPESISHEGYTAHPVHSYWDDFFALRGLKDAAEMAGILGDDERGAALAELRDDFRVSLYASIERTMATHGIDYLPGSVELGDLDPTSTAIALVLAGELEHLPQPALARTFELYYEDFLRRRDGVVDWQAYTAYELRNAGAFVRLGEKRRALEVLGSILADQRPPAWNAWAEITWRDEQAPRFIGDMPHGWVASGFVTAVRTMLVYERESDRSLVLLAGVPEPWVTHESGLSVKRLPTYYGILNLSVRSEGADSLRLRVSGDLSLPPGGIVVQSPLDRELRAVIVNGKPVERFAADSVVLGELPAEVVLGY